MNRKEIRSDRKLLNSLQEKYDKKVMNFMGADFDEEDPTYFDSFAKEDQVIATLDILNREAGPVARTLLKE